jgi:alanyl-tRNA synthetase
VAIVVPVIADIYVQDFPEVAEHRQEVIDTLVKEEKVFRQTLRQGVREFGKLTKANGLTGEVVFKLYDTYGFPVELTLEEAFKQDVKVPDTWQAEFDAKMTEQRERSRTSEKGTFKGGLGGQKDIHKKYHTATHLMYAALRKELGNTVIQRGSNITEERLRFDFTHHEKVPADVLQKVEDLVNEQIAKDLTVTFEEHPTKVAIDELHATGHFGERYGNVVKVYRMQGKDDAEPFSFEICGGPHVDHTGQLGEDGKRFKILKEEASSAGIRRIKAVLQ